MKCPLCGCENLTGAVYCDECGSSLKRPQTQSSSFPSSRTVAGSSVFPTPGSQFAPAPPPTPASPLAPAAPPTPAVPATYSTVSNPVVSVSTPEVLATRILNKPNSYAYAELVVINEPNHKFPLSAEKVNLGRGPAQQGEGFKFDLSNVKDGDTISKKHAVISCDSLGIYIEDLHSGNGTFVNGEKITPGLQRELHGGEEVRLGAARFTFNRLQ